MVPRFIGASEAENLASGGTLGRSERFRACTHPTELSQRCEQSTTRSYAILIFTLRLKTLVLRGFKTFADKTILEFDPRGGITGLIGPNGCGKSNILDSLRWVLGETNPRELRSPSLENVIFAGTTERKPLSLSEVTLVLDNADHSLPLPYDEVEIRRRAYRGGESEFTINRTACRLKDIRDLFLDTGLGQSGYAILTQGAVDYILSAKPEERRMAFEEAAGISKYRVRRDEAARKIEQTEFHLGRLSDLLDHLSRELALMETERQKAEEKRKLSTRARDLELFLLDRERRTLEQKLTVLQQELSRLETVRTSTLQEEQRVQKLEQLRQELRAHRLAWEEAEERLETLRGKRQEIEKAVALAEQEKRLVNKVHPLGNVDEVTIADPQTLEDQIEAAEQQCVERSNRVKELQAEVRAEETLDRERDLFLQEKRAELEKILSLLQETDAESRPESSASTTLGQMLHVQSKFHAAMVAALLGATHYVVSEWSEFVDLFRSAHGKRISSFSAIIRSKATMLREPPTPPTLPQTAGVIGWARDLVEAGELTTLVRTLLGNTVIVENWERADQLQQDHFFSQFPLVTLDGIFLSPLGVVTSGEGPHPREGESHDREERIRDLQNEIERWQAHRSRHQEEIERKQEALRSTEAELAQARLALEKLHGAQSAALTRRAQELTREQQKLLDQFSLAKKESVEKRALYLQLTEKLEQMEKMWMEEEKEIRQIQESLTQARIDQARWETELQSMAVRVEEQFGLRQDVWEKWESSQTLSVAEARRELTGLKQRLEALGSVALSTEELYRRLKDRHDFLVAQCQDIRSSQQELKNQIVELDAQAKISFEEALQKISQEFERMFALLFRGGESRLELTHGEDSGNAGIEVMVKPPGRRWLPITLLSGGERSLTAIALLFSLFRLRPSPFSLLDEVDAALDEANVGRFVDLLRDFAQSIQVLVITHNRKTMESAESLYGVTMEEPGVSKIVSLKLEAVPA